jgi:hypothetical protein
VSAGLAGAITGGANPRSPVATTLGDLVRGLSTAAGQRNAEQLGNLLSKFIRGALTGTTTAPASTSSSTSSLAFLKDPKLSVEEKLARLMVSLSDKYEKQLEEKLKQFSDLESGKATSSTAKKSTTGSALSSLGDGLSRLLGAAGGGGGLLGGAILPKLVGQLAGPVLAGAATALGMPMLAPMILKAGPVLGSIATGAVSSLTGASTAGSTGTTTRASTSSSSSSSTSGSAPSEKALMTEIQILQEKQKEMFTLVSNILRSLHDTKMAVIGNIR